MENKDLKKEEELNVSKIQEEKLRAAYASRKRKRRIKRIISWVVVIVILLTLYVMYSQYQSDRAAQAAAMSRTVARETQVYRTSYQVTVDVSGYVEPKEIQEAGFRTSGPVTAVYVEEGDIVKEGDILASVDNTSQMASLKNIENQLESAKLTGSLKEVELLELQKTAAERNLDYTNIYANFDGIVTKVDIASGDYYEAGAGAVITVIDNSSLTATIEIDEIDMQYVSEGMQASLTFDSLPGVTVPAYVSYVPMLGRYSNSGIGVVDVELTIDNPPEGVIPGYSFEGNLNAEGEESMLVCAQAAVTTGRGGVSTVNKKMEDGTSQSVNVNVRYLGENLVQIISGDIQEGDVLTYESKSGNMMNMMF